MITTGLPYSPVDPFLERTLDQLGRREDMSREQPPPGLSQNGDIQGTHPDDGRRTSLDRDTESKSQPDSRTSDTRNASDTRTDTANREQTVEEHARDKLEKSAELQQIEALAKRDREVRTHENAHRAVAGRYAMGGPSYTYKRGPNGVQYAVGGEVNLDASKIPDDPQATIQKAQTIQKAALAPAQPSSTDRMVAAKAAQMGAEARQEIAKGENPSQSDDPALKEDSTTDGTAQPSAADENADIKGTDVKGGHDDQQSHTQASPTAPRPRTGPEDTKTTHQRNEKSNPHPYRRPEGLPPPTRASGGHADHQPLVDIQV
jgi:hypothetical protein